MQESNSWEHYDHGADIGVRGIGDTKASAFEQAALALTAVVTDLNDVEPATQIEVDCEGADDELVFVDWLNTLIYEMATRKMLFSRFEVRLRENGLSGHLWGESVDVVRHHPAVEVKGATLTTLSVTQNENRQWVAQTVVDV
ncbi:MAG: archease [Arenicellales bacterium]|nr:archease [Arenicellales bacterium]